MNHKNSSNQGKNWRFSESLEEKARSVAARTVAGKRDSSLVGIIEREIALTVEQIDRLRELHEQLRKNMLRLESYIDTDIMKLKPGSHQYINHHVSERNNLKSKLLKIEEERRSLAIEEEEKLQRLHEQLLSLLQKFDQLRLENGN